MKYIEYNKDPFQKLKLKKDDQICHCAVNCGAEDLARTCPPEAHLYCGLRTKGLFTGHCRADGFKPRISGSWKF